MATVKPFRGLRPAPALAAQVASPPYDVLDTEEARAIIRDNPLSFLRVTKSEAEMPPEIDPHDPAVYAQARKTLEAFMQDGTLVQDERPCFYIYTLQMGDHVQTGLVAASSVDEYREGLIKKHELTRPDKEQDRVDHMVATRAQTGAVFLVARARPETGAALAQAVAGRMPAVDFTAVDGIRHTLYVVDDPGHVAAIEAAFNAAGPTYIADGHHRSAAAARVCDVLVAQNPHHTGEEDYSRFLTVIFPHDQVKIMDYNRVVSDLNGLAPDAFLARISERFTVSGPWTEPVRPDAPHRFGMFLGGQWYRLEAMPGTYDAEDPVGVLDVTILQNNLLNPVLGIADQRTDKRIDFVGGMRGLGELERRVSGGRAAVAFALYPTSVDELMAIADAGQIMPPKSTWFEPKLRDAMVVHLI